MSNRINWNDENTAKLQELAGSTDVAVSQANLAEIAEVMGTTARSIGAKLRKLEYTVTKASETKSNTWPEATEAALVELVTSRAGELTYAEISQVFEGGKFTPKQIQGKILNLQLFSNVRKAEPKESVKTYSDAEEELFIGLVQQGATMEKLAAEFGRTIASVRGKALSLLKTEQIEGMPKQETSSAKETADAFKDLNIEEMTVDAIATATGKSERGIKSMLSRRGLTAVDYDGAAKRAKLDSKSE